MKTKELRNWFLARMQEKTTWYGVIGLLTTAGMHFNPQILPHVIEIAVAVSSLAAVLTKEKK